MDKKNETAQELLKKAWNIQQQGNYEDAIKLYQKILGLMPSNPYAKYLMGVALQHLGRGKESEKYFRQVLLGHPDFLPALIDLGLLLVRAGRKEEALPFLRKALSINPEMPEVSFEVAIIYQEIGALKEAISRYRYVLSQKPQVIEAWNNLGAALEHLGQYAEAIDAYQESIKWRSDLPGGWIGLGRIYQRNNQTDSAEEAFRRAAEVSPASGVPYLALGNLFCATNRPQEAEACYRQAQKNDPLNASILNNLGAMLMQEGRLVEAEGHLRQSINLQPNNADAYSNLGTVLKGMGRMNEAEDAMQCALRLDAHHPHASRMLGRLKGEQGFFWEARNLLDCACGAKGNALWRIERASQPPAVPQSTDEIDFFRSELEEVLQGSPGINLKKFVNEITSCDPRPFLHLCYHGQNNLSLRQKYAKIFEAPSIGRKFARSENPWRIGFLVTAGHEGIFLRCCQGILENFSNPELEVTVVAASGGIGKIRAAIKSEDINFLPLPNRFEGILSTLHKADFDLLYYWEIGSDSENYFLPYFRPAPIQCTSWGTPETTGIPDIDFYLSWEGWEPPGAEDAYSETLVRFANPPVFYYRPQLHLGSFRSASHFGLDDQKPLYFCPQNLLKVHPDFDNIIAKILKQDSQAQIIFVEGRYPSWRGLISDRWRQQMGDMADRVIFLPRQSYSDYLNLAYISDAVLDTFHFSGGNTSYELLSLPSAVVTMPGDFARSRFTAGCYLRMGVSDLIAKNEIEYVAKILRLGNDPHWRNEVREKISSANHVLYEDFDAVKEMEEFFLEKLRDGNQKRRTSERYRE